MPQPKNFGFEDEANLLKDSARRFFTEKLPVDALHQLVADDPNPELARVNAWPEELWREMAELGWSGLTVPEAYGGIGMPYVAVAGLLEEHGRAACPSPLLATLQSTAILSSAGDAASGPLAEVLEGCSVSPALMDKAGDTDNPGVAVVNGRLEGVAHYVQDANKVDRFLVLAQNGDMRELYWVDSNAEGVRVEADAIIDLTRDQATVHFYDVEGSKINGDGAAFFAQALPAIWVLVSADMVGGAEWLLQTTVEYAQQRKQFDRPLGFFQAVKHDLVNVMISIDESKSLLYSAACALDTEPERALSLAHMTKASASDTAAFASGRAVQCHGGIGFTWECYLHLYFKRQEHSLRLWGDAAWHRAKLADLTIGEVGSQAA
ncbi:MAG: acyl-CoA dehydrogenase family protein [Pseudomonadota bacterium]